MKTKNGKAVPLILAAELRMRPELLEMWGRLRPACQCRYVRLVEKAKRQDTKIKRVEMVLEMTAAWHKRHYEKIKAKNTQKT